ncbi:unnamed protein product, partial [Polarella glacialis]
QSFGSKTTWGLFSQQRQSVMSIMAFHMRRRATQMLAVDVCRLSQTRSALIASQLVASLEDTGVSEPLHRSDFEHRAVVDVEGSNQFGSSFGFTGHSTPKPLPEFQR